MTSDAPLYPQEQTQDDSASIVGFGIGMLLAGAALGALTALLLASKPGLPAQGQAFDRLSEWKSQAADALAKAREKVVNTIEDHVQESSIIR